jgi:prolipoprotein diacylglyceryltransferase
MEYGQPGAAIPHETFAEVSICVQTAVLVAAGFYMKIAFGGLAALRRRQDFPGELLLDYLTLASASRFLVEFFRSPLD